ncbi:hypothetical protein GF340_02945 [Candidatus Peregrinibacteria bacterium]|nr:hypothetical protein [Candidatus Peregrinibacteria bacterium]
MIHFCRIFFDMKVLVFDTETTGIPIPNKGLEEQPYICQFAGVIYEISLNEKKLTELKRMDLLIKPPVLIPRECRFIHGITDEMVANEPVFNEVSSNILDLFHEADIAAAHNIEFDVAMLRNELARLGKNTLFLPDQTFDTMKETKEVCNIPGRSGGLKSPTLSELYKCLFGKQFDGAHNALNDVLATGECLDFLLKKGIFVPIESNQESLF